MGATVRVNGRTVGVVRDQFLRYVFKLDSKALGLVAEGAALSLARALSLSRSLSLSRLLSRSLALPLSPSPPLSLSASVALPPPPLSL